MGGVDSDKTWRAVDPHGSHGVHFNPFGLQRMQSDRACRQHQHRSFPPWPEIDGHGFGWPVGRMELPCVITAPGDELREAGFGKPVGRMKGRIGRVLEQVAFTWAVRIDDDPGGDGRGELEPAHIPQG